MTGCGESVVRIGGFCFDGLFIGAILLGFAADCPTSFMRRDDPSSRSLLLLACDSGDLQHVVVIGLCSW